jgi:protease YdgD
MVRNGDGFDVVGVDSNFRSNANGPFLYIAVSAAAFADRLQDFAAGRIGSPVGGAAAKPRRP